MSAAEADAAGTPALEARDIRVSSAERTILHGVTLAVASGRTLGIVGESGAGKSLFARAVTGLLPAGLRASGSVRIGGAALDPAAPGGRAWSAARGRDVVLVLQDPFTSLDPLRRCGAQVVAGIATGRRASARARREDAVRRLAEVGLPAGAARRYPFELSGGQCQRVAIAAALAASPRVLVADEPTTALDVRTQKAVLDLLARIQRARGLAVVLITHDLGLARERCDRVAVMRAGRIVEAGPAAEVFARPAHAYTRALKDADPPLDHRLPRMEVPATPGADVLVRGSHLTKTFGRSPAPALDDVSVEVRCGEAVGIVGESGSGKTTLARCLLGLARPDRGRVEFFGPEAGGAGRLLAHPLRRPVDAQIVFQNPYSSLDPALSVGATLAEALGAAGRPAGDVPQLLRQVGLPVDYARRHPSRLSGGERQRVSIARALAPRPRLLVTDECVSALDVTVQAQILELLADLRRRSGIGILFISHDLAVTRQVADRLYVMRRGVVVEQGPTDRVLADPRHPYTRDLLASVPGAAAVPA